MKVAFFVSSFPVRSETFVLTQIAGLLDRGHQVDIWASEIRGPEHLHADFERYGMLGRVRKRRSACGGTLAWRVRARSRYLRDISREPERLAGTLNVFRYGRKSLSLDLLDMARCFSDAPGYDIVHCHFGPNGNDAALLMECGVLGAKLVTTFHSYDVLLGIKTNGACYRRLVHRADAVHSISQYNRTWLERFGFPPDRIFDQPMGIDLSRFRPRDRGLEPDREARILTVARLAPAKGLAYGLDALAAVRRQRPDVRFRYRVVGSGPLEDELKARTLALGLGERVEFAGFQDQGAVRDALHEADVFFLPSLAEGLPIAIMEAMASGLPVIATDVGGNAELVRNGETGRLVPPADPGALAAALLDMLAIPEQWRAYSERSRRLIEQRHDASKLSDRLVRHYRSLVEGAHPGTGQDVVATPMPFRSFRDSQSGQGRASKHAQSATRGFLSRAREAHWVALASGSPSTVNGPGDKQ